MKEHTCSNGKVYDHELRKMVICPVCKKSRKEEIKDNIRGEVPPEERLEKRFGFEGQVLNVGYEFESVILDVEKPILEPQSLQEMEESLQYLISTYQSGELPGYSICYGLGIKGRMDRLIYPMMVKAHQQGLTVHRVLSLMEYSQLYQRADEELDDILKAQVVFVVVNEGCTNYDIAAGKGLMQSRSLKGLPTIFVTTWLIEACSALLSTVNDEELSLAKPVFVTYRQGYSTNGEESNYIRNLKGIPARSAADSGTASAPFANLPKKPTGSFNKLRGL